MSVRSQRRVRLHALAAATAVVVSSMIAAPALAAGKLDLSGLQSAATHDQFIVKYKAGSTARTSAVSLTGALSNAARAVGGGKALGLNKQRRMFNGAEVVRASRKLDRAETETLLRQLAADPNVEYVEIDQIMTHTITTPNDTRYPEQWHYSAANGLRANAAWDRSTGQGVVVAVIDTGITPHADLNGNVLPGYDFIADATAARDGNGRDSNPNDEGDWQVANQCPTAPWASDSSFHGSHVAGTVAAVTNNAAGVAGVAYNARIVPVRVLGACGGRTSDIAEGITWASGGAVTGIPTNANPAEVINLSLGGEGACSSTYQTAITGAVGRGTTVVVAAGNDNFNVSRAVPANCTGVIAVAAMDQNGDRAFYSNYGATMDVAAPGGETCTPNERFLALEEEPRCDVGHDTQGILSTVNTGTTTQSAQGYGWMQGTSMAAPHVAGVVALMQAAVSNPLTPAQIEQALKTTSRTIPAANCPGGCGTGAVDADAAVVEAIRISTPINTVLTKGVAKTGLSAAVGTSTTYTLVVPAGATNLKFVTTGGTGDADISARLGSAPTSTVFDCKSEGGTNAETCTVPTAVAGTYYVTVKAYKAYSGLSLTGDYTIGTPRTTYSNTSDYTISDNVTIDSPITVSGRSGNAPSDASVTVAIVHTYQGDLKVDLVAPDGSLYNIHNRTGASTDNINKTVPLNLSTEALNGTWKLRVNDNGAGDVGRIDSWSVTF